MPLPTWDVFIGLMFLVGIAYGFILRRDKTITTLTSVYIGLVIATNFSKYIFDFFNGNKVIADQLWIRSGASQSTIAIILFVISIIFVSGAINSSQSKAGDLSPIEVFIYSALTIALIIASVLDFLGPEGRAYYLEASRFASIIYDYRMAFILAPPISLIVLNFRTK
ncbi:MAG: hypothetical protein BWY68_00448 [bacterium ADurb.Bin400]|nr:MAG: hypothetical protein BWY68_00448 [bacterium ADurb.Bin400]